MPERDADSELYAACIASGQMFTVAYEEFLGSYMATDIPPQQWQVHANQERPRIQAMLERFEGLDAESAQRRAANVAAYAPLMAQDFFDIAAHRATQRERTQGPPPPVDKLHAAVKLQKFSTVANEVMQQATSPEPTLASPFPTLNLGMMGGFRRGELTYLAARPRIGKSAMAVEIATYVAQHGTAVLIVSCEMTSVANARRMLAQHGKIDAGAMRKGRGVEWAKVTDTIQRMYDYPIWLTQNATTIGDITAAIEQTPDVGFVVVDYLQLLTASASIKDRRIQVESLSRGLKQLTLRKNVSILALSSVNRGLADKGDQRPTLSSLRESGNLEHDADVILILHRKPDATATECHVEKNRDGRSGFLVELEFRPEWVSFEEQCSDVEYPDEDRELFNRGGQD